MEMAIANSTKTGDRALVISNGYFGDRFAEICERKGLFVDVLRAQWGKAVELNEIEASLLKTRYDVIIVSHVDTSTGVVAKVGAIGDLLKRFPETLYIVDGVAATGGEYIDVDGMGIDILFTGSQKAFGVCPGMFVLWASKKALKHRESLGSIREYYVDIEKWIPIMQDPSKYFSTPAINLIWAMKKATEIIEREGLLNRHNRHQENAAAIRAALKEIGLNILAEPGCQASTLSCVLYPEGVDDVKFRNFMIEEGVIVAGALGPYSGKAFRIGHMGNIMRDDVIILLNAIEKAMIKCGCQLLSGSAVDVYKKNTL
jgi:aspartate aminotransferase-like enzyme